MDSYPASAADSSGWDTVCLPSAPEPTQLLPVVRYPAVQLGPAETKTRERENHWLCAATARAGRTNRCHAPKKKRKYSILYVTATAFKRTPTRRGCYTTTLLAD